jgi:YfiH family protein
MRDTLSVLEIQPPKPFYALGDHIAVDLPGARGVFTTRRGGVSKAPYDSLNLGLLVDGDRVAPVSNRSILARGLGVELAYVRQVHGSAVRVVDAPTDPDEPRVEADGLATTTRRVAAMVLTADCLPIAIAGGGAVAAVHAGWKGLASGVVAAGVQAVRELGTKDRTAGPIAAAIGPGASVCCYEVSDEVHERFADLGLDRRWGQNLDLKAIARAQLADAGVEQIHTLPWCTICSRPDLFFSHRRDHGVTGRQAGLAWLI